MAHVNENGNESWNENQKWKMKSGNKSKNYTTHWGELIQVN